MSPRSVKPNLTNKKKLHRTDDANGNLKRKKSTPIDMKSASGKVLKKKLLKHKDVFARFNINPFPTCYTSGSSDTSSSSSRMAIYYKRPKNPISKSSGRGSYLCKSYSDTSSDYRENVWSTSTDEIEWGDFIEEDYLEFSDEEDEEYFISRYPPENNQSFRARGEMQKMPDDIMDLVRRFQKLKIGYNKPSDKAVAPKTGTADKENTIQNPEVSNNQKICWTKPKDSTVKPKVSEGYYAVASTSKAYSRKRNIDGTLLRSNGSSEAKTFSKVQAEVHIQSHILYPCTLFPLVLTLLIRFSFRKKI